MTLSWRFVHWAWKYAQRRGIVTADTPAGRRFAAFGTGSMLAFPQGTMFGEGSMVIGTDVLVGELVTRTYFESQGKRAYAVRSTLNVTPVAQDAMASRAA